MKIALGYALILGLCISFCECYNFTISRDPYHKEVYQFVKQIIEDWNQKHVNETNEISIMNMNSDTSLFDTVRKAIPKENPILLPENGCKDVTKYLNLRESSFFIIVSKFEGNQHKYNAQYFGCIDLSFWSPQTKILVIPPKKITNEDYALPSSILIALRELQFIIPYAHENKFVVLYQGDALHRKMDMNNMTTNTDVLFNDKLRNMKGYEYTALIPKKDLKLVLRSDKLMMIEFLLLETIAKKQNAIFNRNSTQFKEYESFTTILEQGNIDMVLNYGSYSSLLGKSTIFKTVNTYETNGFCALVPIRPTNEVFLKFIIKPFDNYVWCVLSLLIIIGAFIWHGFHKISDHQVDSGTAFAVDILLAFTQQSVNIRRGHLVPKMMLQISIFMMIVIANVYQGIITSILMDPQKHQKIDNIHELMSMEYDIYSDSLFLKILTEYNTDQKLTDQIKPLDVWLQNPIYIKRFQNVMTTTPNNVLIVLCDVVSELLESQINDKIKGYDVYYELNQKIMPYFETILLTRRSPFYEKLSDLSLKIHESGIKQYWTMLMEKTHNSRNGNDESLLGMREMKSIFGAYLYGIMIACFVFLLEFFKNGIKLFYRQWIKMLLRCIRRYVRRKVTPRVQRI